MQSELEKLLVVESDDGLRAIVVEILKDAGYKVSTDCGEGMKSILEFDPDAVILGANPPQLDCCDLLSEIKGSEHTQNVRVIMLSAGGAAERTRGLDLGADDVLSLPPDRHEFLTRVRWQLRNKHAIDEFRRQASAAAENRNAAQQVLTAVNEERHSLRVARMLTLAVVIVAGLSALIFYQRTQ